MDSGGCCSFIDITNSLNNNTSSCPSTLLDSNFESDITDAHIDPRRSPSRLGFNFKQVGDSECAVIQAENTETKKQARMKWTYSLFQTRDQDSSDSLEQVPLCADIAFCSSGSFELDNDSESSEDDSDEDDPPARSTFFTGPIIQRSASSSQFPLANGPPTRPPAAPFLSTILSPLSPNHPGTQALSTSPQPIDINHHGLSKSALMHQKWFWSTRFDEWAIWEAQMEVADTVSGAYGGMAIPPSSCPALSRDRYPSPRKSPPSSPCPSPVSNTVNPRIFPRLGDISALRDPYSMDIDRCFCHFPLWTVHKTLYMFDMHHRSASLDDKVPQKTVDDSDLPSHDPTLVKQADEATHLTGSSDSDTTLVSKDAVDGCTTKNGCSEKEYDTHDSEDEDGDFRTWDGVRAWEISWYARWELLIELVTRDEARRNALEFVAPSSSDRPPMFYFTGENDEVEEEDDEDEDYGTIISNPLYGRRVQAGFGTAQEFFANQDLDVRKGAKMICV